MYRCNTTMPLQLQHQNDIHLHPHQQQPLLTHMEHQQYLDEQLHMKQHQEVGYPSQNLATISTQRHKTEKDSVPRKRRALRIPKEWKQKYGRHAQSSSGSFEQDAETRLLQALRYVQTSGQNITEAAKRFGVPRSTLNERLKRNDPYAKRVRGTHPTLTREEEDVMCKWLVTAYRRGHAITPKRFATAVKELLDSLGRTCVFANDNRPTSGWVKTFRRRHPTIRFIKHDKWNDPKHVSVKSVGWLEDLLEHLHDERVDPLNLLTSTQGGRVFCLAEYGAGIHYDGTVADTLLCRDDYQHQRLVTVLCCLNAKGDFVQPCLLYPEHALRPHVVPHLGLHVGVSSKAWLSPDSLYYWVRLFVSHLNTKKVSRPVLLVVYGEYTLATLPLCDACAQAGIILHVVPRTATDFVHPINSFIQDNVNVAYKECFVRYMQTFMANVTLDSFPLVFIEAWNKVQKNELVPNGFHASGIISLSHYSNDSTQNVGALGQTYCSSNRNAVCYVTESCHTSEQHNNNTFEKLGSAEDAPPLDKVTPSSANKIAKSKKPRKQNGKSTSKDVIVPRMTDAAVKYERTASDVNDRLGYLDGLQAALQAVVSFVPGPVRSIYQDWIEQGEDSETRDPVFLVWRRIDTMLKQATSMQQNAT